MNEQMQLVMNLHADRQPVQLDGGVRDVVPQPYTSHVAALIMRCSSAGIEYNSPASRALS